MPIGRSRKTRKDWTEWDRSLTVHVKMLLKWVSKYH